MMHLLVFICFLQAINNSDAEVEFFWAKFEDEVCSIEISPSRGIIGRLLVLFKDLRQH